MPDVLPGYTYDRASQRYRNGSTGRFVGRNTVVDLLDSSVSSAERRLGALTTAYHEGSIDASVWVEQMRSELRRLHLQNAALGAGGWDSLTFSDYGRIGYKLRDDYQRLNRFAHDIRDGNSTIAQSLARTNMYVGRARTNYWEVERERAQASSPGMHIIERRVLTPAEHCKSCLDYYGWGWQLIGILPIPGDGSTECLTNDKCILVRREVPFDELGDWVTSKRPVGPEPTPSAVPVPVSSTEQAPPLEKAIRYRPASAQLERVRQKVDQQMQRIAEINGVDTADVEGRISNSFNRLATNNPVALNFHSSNVDSLLNDGRFKSQFETNRSGAILNTAGRANSEELGLGIPEKIKPEQRPIYGYLRVQDAEKLTGYGDITFVFKDAVKRRSTVTAGDSFYDFAGGESAGTPMLSAGKESWGRRVDTLHDYATGTSDINKVLRQIQYFEIQIHDGVELSDVLRVIDTKKALTPMQVKRLNDLGVEVWDSD